MAKAKQGDKVQVHYTGKLDDGSVFDTSAKKEPLSFTIGEGSIIPGFNAAVIGMEEGQKKTAKMAPDQAYGERNKKMLIEISREQLPTGVEPKPGMQLKMTNQGGQSMVVQIAEVKDKTLVLDGNHPLAGKALTFEIELVKIG
ncbi:MAG: peptidylprolyl isomerase [Candidatus Saganbacteria bacterium]|nr:peptidylprolyl isomerase [Candidatus Saganbacteria bacterium]